MDVRVGLRRRLSVEELMLLNCGVGEDSTHGHHQTGQHKNRIDYIFAAKDGETLYSQQKQDPELTVADLELLIVKFRLKLKKGGETT